MNISKTMAIAAVGALAAAAAPAFATAVLTISDGIDPTVTVADNSALDLNHAEGGILWAGTLGVWTINVETGLTAPLLGSFSSPQLDLTSTNLSSGAGVLDIDFSQTGFSLPFPGDNGAATNIGGTVAGTGSVYAETGYDPADTALSLADSCTTSPASGSFTSGAFSAMAMCSLNVGGGGPFSVTEHVNIVHGGAGVTSLDYNFAPVPEPTTLALIGGGLIGMCVFGRRRLSNVRC